MTLNLSIKNVPDDIVERLRKRAERNHRSLQGELLAIVEDAAGRFTVGEVSATRAPGVHERAPAYRVRRDAMPRNIAPRSEAALMIREDRDGRTLTVDEVVDRLRALGAGTPSESAQWVRQLRTAR